MKISSIVSLILGLCALLTVAFGVYFYFDNRLIGKASCEEVKKVEQGVKKVEQMAQQVEKRLDLKILWDRFQIKQQRIDMIKDEFKREKKQIDSTTEKTIRGLETEKVEIEKDMKALEKK